MPHTEFFGIAEELRLVLVGHNTCITIPDLAWPLKNIFYNDYTTSSKISFWYQTDSDK